MTNITVRWAGSPEATSGSTYKIERTLDNTTWTTLAAAQASTSPYVARYNTLSLAATLGDTSIYLTSGADFGTTGYAWIEDALISWSDKNVNQLTGVVWYSGYGTYLAGTRVTIAHESYSDSGVTITNNAVLYRITHTLSGVSSHPVYLWFFSPPEAVSDDHCVVVAAVATDLGLSFQEGVIITCYLSEGDQVANIMGHVLLTNRTDANSEATNVFGLAFFQCWKNGSRHRLGDTSDAEYTFTIEGSVTVAVPVIPDLSWVLLSQLV